MVIFTDYGRKLSQRQIKNLLQEEFSAFKRVVKALDGKLSV
jgi:hypothetical protein